MTVMRTDPAIRTTAYRLHNTFCERAGDEAAGHAIKLERLITTMARGSAFDIGAVCLTAYVTARCAQGHEWLSVSDGFRELFVPFMLTSHRPVSTISDPGSVRWATTPVTCRCLTMVAVRHMTGDAGCAFRLAPLHEVVADGVLWSCACDASGIGIQDLASHANDAFRVYIGHEAMEDAVEVAPPA